MTGPTTSVLDLPAESFDIIIVGGGTAGLVLANRLSEDPALQVLVVEAGADRYDDPRITTPGLAVSLFDDPNYDWQFVSEPQVGLRSLLHLRVVAFCLLSKCLWACQLRCQQPINFFPLIVPSEWPPGSSSPRQSARRIECH